MKGLIMRSLAIKGSSPRKSRRIAIYQLVIGVRYHAMVMSIALAISSDIMQRDPMVIMRPSEFIDRLGRH